MMTRCLVEPIDLNVFVPAELADKLADVVSRIIDCDAIAKYSLPDDLMNDALDALATYSLTYSDVCTAISMTRRSIVSEMMMSVPVEL